MHGNKAIGYKNDEIECKGGLSQNQPALFTLP